MERKEKALQHIKQNGQGVEIGPSFTPLAPKKEGYNVHIIDHINREGLVAKYKDHDVNLDNIEEVDFVWKGERYAELTGKRNYYDWIIAAHVIEHTPDLIGFLHDCETIIKNDGVISLVIPDKRFCFDHYRPVTGIAKIIDSHFQKNTMHTPGTIAEHFLNVVSNAERITWDAKIEGKYKLLHSLEEALQGMTRVRNENSYVDAHAWCFVPNSFRLIVYDLFSLGLIPFQEVGFFPTEGCEFFITLGRSGKGAQMSRLEILQRMESEIRDVRPIAEQIYKAAKEKVKELIGRSS